MAIDGRAGNAPNARNPGPYEAIVVSHLDPKYMGTLEVELLKNVASGNQAERSGQIVQVKYLSPFYGVTPLGGTSNNEDFQSTQKSYGMWFVPPDVGTRVLVIFSEGNFARGYWIGCVQDTFMNFMTPDPWAGTSFNNRDTGLKLPVGEYNKNSQGTSGNNPTRYLKPVNPFLYRRLLQQGLIDDPVRGPSSSSARREVPSSVFGISTPGPVDKNEGAPRTPTGPSGVRANTYTSRLGGSSFVMDDGDDKLLRKGPAGRTPSEYADLYANETGGDVNIPANELVRIRTRTGHQILLHNSEDLIYIANAKGTAWLEMTSNGKIDIYAADSVSVHSNQDLNFTADRDINFTAFQNVNFVVGDQMRTDVGNSYSLTAGDFIASNAGGSISEHAQGSITNYAFSGWTAVTQSKMALLAASNLNIGSTAAIGIECDGNLRLHTDSDFDLKALANMRLQTDVGFDLKVTGLLKVESTGALGIHSTGANVLIKGTSDVLINGPVPQAAAAAQQPAVADPTDPVPTIRAGQTARVPQHEPWFEHENINPSLYTPSNTRAGSAQQQSYPPPQNDTFAHGSNAPQRRTVESSERPGGYDATAGNYDAASNLPSATGGTPAGPLTSPPAGLINGFNAQQTVNFLNAIGTRESNNAYNAVNTIGFSGKYQFGKLALEDGGYIKPGASRLGTNAQVLGNPDNWTGKDGIRSQEDWLNSPEAQEAAMIVLANSNKRTLERINGIKPGDDFQTQAGMMAGAHLLGAGGIRNWREGRGGADAYGTTGQEYFTLGRNAVA
jgi:hypothetical protein